MIHWSSGREGHNNYRRDLVIWLVHLIYTVRLAKVALCYNYVILNYCIRFAVVPCVRLPLNSCIIYIYDCVTGKEGRDVCYRLITWQDEICHVCWIVGCLCVCLSVCIINKNCPLASVASFGYIAIIFSEQLGIVALRR